MIIYILCLMALFALVMELFHYYVKPSVRYSYGCGDRLPSELEKLVHAYVNNHSIKIVKKSANVYDITLKNEMARFQCLVTISGRKTSFFVFTCSHEYLYECENMYKSALLADCLFPENRHDYHFDNGFVEDVAIMGELEKVTYFK